MSRERCGTVELGVALKKIEEKFTKFDRRAVKSVDSVKQQHRAGERL